MRIRSILISLAVAVAGPWVAASPATATTAVPDSDAYIVSFDHQYLSSLTADVEALGGNVIFSHPVGLAIVSGLDGTTAGSLFTSLGVNAVLPDAQFQLAPGHVMGSVSSVDAAQLDSPDDPTQATRYSRQWNMRAIDADGAWAAGRLGSPDVTVAILDTGIAYTHPDLVGRVDLSRSASFVPSDDDLVETFFPDAHPIADLNYHGTHVAATVASNGIALAGVTSKTTLMGVKVCDVSGSCPTAAIFQGVLHAVDNGADVINMSLGGTFDKSQTRGYVGIINQLFTYANSMGVTVVVSAGNNAANLDRDDNLYKTYCSQQSTVCVSATGPDASPGPDGPWENIDSPAFYTNYGRSSIDVAGPGGNSGGFVWAACSTFSLVVQECRTGVFILGLRGTSMAAPHVSGAAALAVEDFGRNPGRISTALMQSADDLGRRGVDPYYGKGRLNVATLVGA